MQRTVGYAVAYAGLTLTIQFLKRRLLDAEREQRTMAHQDPLTGLANRRAFDKSLGAALAGGEARFALLLIDVDFFKQINDRYGHSTGDRVLRELAAHASAEVRSADVLARIGGDELALFAPGAGRDAALRLAGRCGRRRARDARRRRRAALDHRLTRRLPGGRHRSHVADARARSRAARRQARASRLPLLYGST